MAGKLIALFTSVDEINEINEMRFESLDRVDYVRINDCGCLSLAGELGERAKELEGSLLNVFGLKRRPRPGQQAIVVPEFLVELYRQQTGLEVDTTNLNLAGKHTQSANTVRTFTHKGSSSFLVTTPAALIYLAVERCSLVNHLIFQ